MSLSYCRACLVMDLRRYPRWAKLCRGYDEIRSDAILYVHEDFTVTLGPTRGEHIVFDATTANWQDFCREVLGIAHPASGQDA